MTYNIAVLGGGAWGLALSKLLSENGHSVRVWEYNTQFVELLRTTHSNPNLLSGITLPQAITYNHNFAAVLTPDTDFVLCAVPSQFLRGVMRQAAPFLAPLTQVKAIINVAKGVEEHTFARMSDVLADELPAPLKSRIVILSGPSHAEEVARRIPTTVVIAGKDEELLISLQTMFSNDYFRCYRSCDMIGVQIGGAVKNIISIAAGIIAGLGYGDNTIGALLTRGIVEIQRFGVALGADAETFYGLSGIGDLITTATSPHSRNRYVGFEIGKGRRLDDILAGMQSVAEGVATCRSVYEYAQKLNVEMPITREIHAVLFDNKPALQAMHDLMTRSLKPE